MGNCFCSPDTTARSPSPSKDTPPARQAAWWKPSGGGRQDNGRPWPASAPGPGQVLETPMLRQFTLAELRAATRGFSPEMLLGIGGFGWVYKGWVEEHTHNLANSTTGVIVAVKKLDRESIQGLQDWQSKVNFLGRLSHPNLVRLLGYCSEDRELLLVYEFMAKGSLENHLFGTDETFEPLSWSLRLKIAIGAARGLAFLHSSETQIIYREFNTSNILLDSLSLDFGLENRSLDGESHIVTTRVVGTYRSAAPEYIITGRPHAKSDVYSFGVVLLALLTGLRAHDWNRPSHLRNLVEWARPHLAGGRKLTGLMDQRLGGRYPPKAAARAARLANKCLRGNPKRRPSMADVVAALEEIEAIA